MENNRKPGAKIIFATLISLSLALGGCQQAPAEESTPVSSEQVSSSQVQESVPETSTPEEPQQLGKTFEIELGNIDAGQYEWNVITNGTGRLKITSQKCTDTSLHASGEPHNEEYLLEAIAPGETTLSFQYAPSGAENDVVFSAVYALTIDDNLNISVTDSEIQGDGEFENESDQPFVSQPIIQ